MENPYTNLDEPKYVKPGTEKVNTMYLVNTFPLKSVISDRLSSALTFSSTFLVKI